jgi:hypothetical protein
VLGEENKYEQIYDVDVDKNRYVSVQKGSGCLARALNSNNRSIGRALAAPSSLSLL